MYCSNRRFCPIRGLFVAGALMKRWILLRSAIAVFTWCFAGPEIPALAENQVEQAKPCRLERLASLEIHYLSNGWPTVPVSIGGKSRNMIISLWGDSAISDALASELKLRPTPIFRSGRRIPFVNIAGLPAMYVATVSEVGIGAAHSTDVTMYVAGTMMSGRVVPFPDGADGVIGATLLSNFDAELDLHSNKLNLYAPGHCGGASVFWASSYAAVPFTFDPIGDVVLDMQLDGKDVSVIPTLEMEHARMGITALEEIFGIEKDSPMLKPTGQGDDLLRYPFHSLNLGGLTINNPAIEIYRDKPSQRCNGKREGYRICWGGADVRLGLAELQRLHLFFAFPEKTLYLTPAGGEPHRLVEQAATAPESTSSLPVSLHCGVVPLEGAFVQDGPSGYATAKVSVDINSTSDPSALRVTPTSPAVCTVSAKKPAIIASSSFSIEKGSPPASDDAAKHVDVQESVSGQGSDKRYIFTVKAKDMWKGELTLTFPTVYREAPR